MLGVVDVSGGNTKGPQSHVVVFNGNTLLILPLEGVSKETDSKVHGGGPHAVPAQSRQNNPRGVWEQSTVNVLRLRPEYGEGVGFRKVLSSL